MNDFKKAATGNSRTNPSINQEQVKQAAQMFSGTTETYSVHVDVNMAVPDFDFLVVIHTWFAKTRKDAGCCNLFGASETWHCQETGALVYEEFRRNGELHRLNGPAKAFYDRETGEILKSDNYLNGIKVEASEINKYENRL